MSKAVLCPVCNGKGKLDKTESWSPTGVVSGVTCYGCNGKGWVEIFGEEHWKPNPYTYPWTTEHPIIKYIYEVNSDDSPIVAKWKETFNNFDIYH